MLIKLILGLRRISKLETIFQKPRQLKNSLKNGLYASKSNSTLEVNMYSQTLVDIAIGVSFSLH